jgi:hypothetical protein
MCGERERPGCSSGRGGRPRRGSRSRGDRPTELGRLSDKDREMYRSKDRESLYRKTENPLIVGPPRPVGDPNGGCLRTAVPLTLLRVTGSMGEGGSL